MKAWAEQMKRWA